MLTIRPYLPSDAPALRDICIRTGASGGDATGTTIDDGLLPDRFATPYAEFAPELAFVVASDAVGAPADAVGYVLGVPDTAAFVRWYRDEWVPALEVRYEALEPSTSADPLVRGAFEPERMLPPGLDDYPAHLHIDLLPEAQGRGFGRELIERECAALAAAGAPGVHLGVSAANAGALAFYPRVGFTQLRRDGDTVLFGRAL